MFELQSPEIDKIMDAIAACHDKHGVTIEKDAKGARNATYAKLDNILFEIHKRCSEFKLTLIQRKLISEDNKEALESMLFHRESKQWLKSLSLIHTNPQAQSPDQVWGGSDTYHRRYDAMGLLGLCSSDDPADHDGWKDHAPQSSQEPHAARALFGQSEVVEEKKSPYISEKQQGFLKVQLNGNKELAVKILAKWNISKLSDIPWRQFNDVLAFVKENS
jgi:hypothetical protein